MSFLETLHNEMGNWSETVQHGAAWLTGAASIAEKDIKELEASSPLVKEATDMAMAWASTAVPGAVSTAEQISTAILELARRIVKPAAPAAVSASADNEADKDSAPHEQQ